MVYITHVDLKTNIWLFRVGSSSSSMDHEDLVYKTDSLVTEFFIEFSCINPNTRFYLLINPKIFEL